MTMSDLDLYVRWKKHGDRDAAGELVDKHAGDLWRWATKRWGRLGEEVAQETWMAVIHGRGFTGRGSFSSWLRAIARQQAGRLLRAAQRRAVELEAVELEASVTSPTYALRLGQLRLAIEQMSPAEQREAARLYWLQGKSIHEIAEQLAIPENTVKTRLHRARRKLELMLAERASEASP